jgi:hypothetical protein
LNSYGSAEDEESDVLDGVFFFAAVGDADTGFLDADAGLEEEEEEGDAREAG